MNPPLISIIIVNWNTRTLLCQCLSTLGADGGFEIIVVDNNSRDGSVEACRSAFPHVRLMVNAENIGFAKACNQGARQANGDLLLFLNSDALAQPEVVRRLAAAMEETGAHLAGPKLVLPGGRIQSASARNLPTPGSEFLKNIDVCGRFAALRGELRDYERAQEVECVSGAAAMIRTEVFWLAGGWPEDYFMYAEDIDLCKRIRDRGYRIRYVPSCSVIHLDGGSSKSSVRMRLRRSWLGFAAMTRFIIRNHGRFLGALHAIQYPLYMGTLLTRALCRKLSWKRKLVA